MQIYAYIGPVSKDLCHKIPKPGFDGKGKGVGQLMEECHIKSILRVVKGMVDRSIIDDDSIIRKGSVVGIVDLLFRLYVDRNEKKGILLKEMDKARICILGKAIDFFCSVFSPFIVDYLEVPGFNYFCFHCRQREYTEKEY